MLTRRVVTGIGGILAVLVLIFVLQYLDVGRIAAHMAAANPWYILAASGLYLLSWPLRGLRYRTILATTGYRERWSVLTGAIFISQTGNLIVPARAGDAIRAVVLQARRDVPYPTGGASLAVERVFDLLTITLIAGVVTLVLTATGTIEHLTATLFGGQSGGETMRSGRIAVIVAAGVGVAAIGAVLVIVGSAFTDTVSLGRFMPPVSDRPVIGRLTEAIAQFVADVQTVTVDPAAFVRVGAGSLLIWSVDVLTAVAVVVAFGYQLTPLVVAVAFFAVSVGNLAKVLPLTPGGIGLYEGAFTLLVVSLTPIGPAGALSIAIVDHAIKNVVTLVGGLGAAAWLNVSLVTAVETGRSAVERSDVDG